MEEDGGGGEEGRGTGGDDGVGSERGTGGRGVYGAHLSSDHSIGIIWEGGGDKGKEGGVIWITSSSLVVSNK